MKGFPKGFLRGAHGLCIVEHHWRMAVKLGWEAVMVGVHPAYAHFAKERDIVCLEDSPPGIGPLGGLSALLGFAKRRFCIALACDMPHVAFEDLEALALSPSQAAALVPRRDYWEPLFARYNPCVASPALEAFLEAGGRSFQGFLERLKPEVFSPKAQRTLEDWDCPEDLGGAGHNN
jgi:molybdopterin-guanine dinucleotide biosynthesis protein A